MKETKAGKPNLSLLLHLHFKKITLYHMASVKKKKKSDKDKKSNWPELI